MTLSRRELFQTASVVSGGAAAEALLGPTGGARLAAAQDSQAPLPAAFSKLQPLGERVKPIGAEEFQGRIARAQQLMSEASPRFDALYVTPGTSLAYFTGIRWGLSERIVALLLPRQGEPVVVCPGFEEGRLRENLRWPMEVRVWQEDESPYALAAKWISERGIRAGRVGVERSEEHTSEL